jgi:hypothetical protein
MIARTMITSYPMRVARHLLVRRDTLQVFWSPHHGGQQDAWKAKSLVANDHLTSRLADPTKVG